MRMRGLLVALVLGLRLLCTGVVGRAEPPVVKMLFFYSPSCHKCEAMIEEYWPSAFAKYGDQLQVLFIDTSFPDNLEMWQAAEAQSGVRAEERGVPGVIIGQDLVIGDEPIKAQLYGLIDQYLAKGGVEFPPVQQAAQTPGLTPPSEMATPTLPSTASPTRDMRTGSWLAGAAVVLALGAGLLVLRRRRSVKG